MLKILVHRRRITVAILEPYFPTFNLLYASFSDNFLILI
ncbi:unnamed protein product [Spirodela intermedia]|uniref:Uncharacterized protein n=1 Tax=Spirodela intermedia TaxID=51605 RepID=A0ABN7E9T5_SPIIN|nr:unnamed protein product [Spirodela intermedia]